MAARGVAQSKPIVIGVLGSGFGPSSAILIDAFKQGLGENGLAEGRDYVLDVRWAEGDYTRFSALASELTQRKSSLIVVTTIAAARSAQQPARTIPVVMTGLIDPVGAGLIASLARPGGNTTDISSMSQDVTAKGLELLRVVIPEQRGQSKQHRFSHAGGQATIRPIPGTNSKLGQMTGRSHCSSEPSPLLRQFCRLADIRSSSRRSLFLRERQRMAS